MQECSSTGQPHVIWDKPESSILPTEVRVAIVNPTGLASCPFCQGNGSRLHAKDRLQGIYWGYIGIMENEMETTIMGF